MSDKFMAVAKHVEWPIMMSPEAGKQRLLELGTTLGRRITALVDNAAGLSISLAESGQAVRNKMSLGAAVARQEDINQTGASMQQLTFALSLANHSEAIRLKHMVLMGHNHTRKLELRLEEQADAILSLNDSVSELEGEASFHREQAARLRQDLDLNTSLLQRTVAQQHTDRQAHAQVLQEQQRLLERLYARKIHHDAIVDALLSGLSLWAVNMALVDAPLRVCFALIPRPRMRQWLRQSAKLMLLIWLFSRLRRHAQMSGIHNSMGSIVAYGQQARKWLPLAVQSRIMSATATERNAPATPGLF